MKFSKPGEAETAEPADSDPSSPVGMPVIESALTEELNMDPMPLDETVQSNADLLNQLLSQDHGQRIKELEDRVDQLEAENEELRESLQETNRLLSMWAEALVENDSLSDITEI